MRRVLAYVSWIVGMPICFYWMYLLADRLKAMAVDYSIRPYFWVEEIFIFAQEKIVLGDYGKQYRLIYLGSLTGKCRIGHRHQIPMTGAWPTLWWSLIHRRCLLPKEHAEFMLDKLVDQMKQCGFNRNEKLEKWIEDKEPLPSDIAWGATK